MKPFEFTSTGGGGVALSRRVKRRKPTFYEVIKSVCIDSDSFVFQKAMGVSERRYLKKNTTYLCRGQIYAV